MNKKLDKTLYKRLIQELLALFAIFILLVIIDKIRTVLSIDIKVLWVVPLTVSFFAWVLIKDSLVVKAFIISSALVLGYYLFFVFTINVHTFAYNVCIQAIKQKYGKLPQELNSGGFYKYHLQARECEYKLAPFPWFANPEITDNPPGFN